MLSTSSQLGPQSQSTGDLFLEGTVLGSTCVDVFFYALQMALFFSCFRSLLKHRQETNVFKLLFTYCIFVAISSTIFAALNIYTTQLQFVVFRNFPGGPLAFTPVEDGFPVYKVYLSAYLCGNIAADILLLWRCRAIWKQWLKRRVDIFLVPPAALVICFSFVMGVFFIRSVATLDNVSTTSSRLWPSAHLGSSLILNISLTLLIVGRMYAHLRKIRATLGRSHIRPYQAVSRIFIQCAALYLTNSVILLATYVANNPIYKLFLAANPPFQIIASYLILYQVGRGTAWETSDANCPHGASSVEFCHPSAIGMGPGDISTSRVLVDVLRGCEEDIESGAKKESRDGTTLHLEKSRGKVADSESQLKVECV